MSYQINGKVSEKFVSCPIKKKVITFIHISNKSKYISTKQFSQCIQLLPDEYKDLDINIVVLSYKLEFLKYIRTERMWAKLYNVFTNKLNGTSCNYCNKIFICAFNFQIQDSFEYNELQKLKLIETLYHEIEHQYQRQSIEDLYTKIVLDKLHNKQIPYHDRWEELDARKFSSKMMNDNYDKISQILKVR